MKKLAIILLVGLVATGTVFAGTEAGMREVQLQGSLTRSSNSENDDLDYSITGQLIFNYFFAPQFSIGGSIMMFVSMSDPEVGDEQEFGATFLMMRADFYFTGDGSGNVIPYIGGQGGGVNYAYTTEDENGKSTIESETTIAYGGHAGFKVFPSEVTSWNIEGNITMYEPEAEKGQEQQTLTDMSLMVGFSYYF